MQAGPWCVSGHSSEVVITTKKVCTRCEIPKDLSLFHKHKTGKHGVRSVCKECCSVWDRHDPKRIKKIQSYRKKWADENPDKVRAIAHDRRAKLNNARVQWSDSEAIRKVFNEAIQLSEATGEKHAVDHQVPLIGRPVEFFDDEVRQVCGLHVEYNLTPLISNLNSSKSNKLVPENAVNITDRLSDGHLRVWVATRDGKGFKVARYLDGELVEVYEEEVGDNI